MGGRMLLVPTMVGKTESQCCLVRGGTRRRATISIWLVSGHGFSLETVVSIEIFGSLA